MDFLCKNIRTIQAGVQKHNVTCGMPARAILLHPTEHAKLGVTELWGLAVLADDRVRLGFFQVDCEGSAWEIEKELALYLHPPVPKSQPRTPDPVEHPLAARADS